MSVDNAADTLWEAAATGTPCAPIHDLLDVDLADAEAAADAAYAVQQRNVERTISERGWRVCGRKIGLTAPAVQEQLGVDQPDFGALYAETSHYDGDTVDITTLLQPRIEAEVALVLGSDLDRPSNTIADILRATEFALPALEIVDSRIADWNIQFVDTVADNASAGRFVLGTVPRRLDIDLAAVTMTMSIGGEERSTGRGSSCLGNPLNAARWLADTMARRGTPLRAGDVVLTGALGPMAPVRPGDEVAAEIAGLGRVHVSFSTNDRVPVRESGHP